MLKKFVIACAAVATLVTMTVDSAEAKKRHYKHRVHHALTTGSIPKFDTRSSNAPLAFQIFCLRFAGECRGSTKSTVAYSSRVRATIASVNNSVNNSMRYVADKGDVWQIGGSTGDCEDFALTKRSKLIRAGIPSGALRMAVVRTEKGEGHAVLIVKTTAGEFVLDNRRKEIRPRSQMGYSLVAMASANPGRWN